MAYHPNSQNRSRGYFIFSSINSWFCSLLCHPRYVNKPPYFKHGNPPPPPGLASLLFPKPRFFVFSPNGNELAPGGDVLQLRPGWSFTVDRGFFESANILLRLRKCCHPRHPCPAFCGAIPRDGAAKGGFQSGGEGRRREREEIFLRVSKNK